MENIRGNNRVNEAANVLVTCLSNQMTSWCDITTWHYDGHYFHQGDHLASDIFDLRDNNFYHQFKYDGGAEAWCVHLPFYKGKFEFTNLLKLNLKLIPKNDFSFSNWRRHDDDDHVNTDKIRDNNVDTIEPARVALRVKSVKTDQILMRYDDLLSQRVIYLHQLNKTMISPHQTIPSPPTSLPTSENLNLTQWCIRIWN